MRPRSDAYLTKVVAAIEAKGLRAKYAVRQGLAAEVIRQYAQDAAVSLIAMSTHGRSGLGRLVMGSVAELVPRGAPVPVLLWKAPAGTAVPGSR